MTALHSTSAARRRRAASFISCLEMLESRTLLSAITAYNVDQFIQAEASVVDPAGNLWLADGVQQIEKVHKNTDGSLTTSVYENDHLNLQVAYDPVNQDMYISEADGFIQQMDLNGNVLNTYAINSPDQSDFPESLTVATDGSIWFTTSGRFGTDANQTYTDDIGHMSLSGNFTFQQLAVTNSEPITISSASDNSIWFGSDGIDGNTTTGLSYVGQASADSTGKISVTTYSIPDSIGEMGSLVVAPDNSIWYSITGDTNSVSNRPPITESINHATLANGALSVTTYDLPKAPSEGVVFPANLHLDSSGNLWFADLDDVDMLDTSTGSITRINANNPSTGDEILVVGPTDIWISYAGSPNYNLGDIDLSTYTPPIISTTPDIATPVGQAYSGTLAVFSSADAGNFNYTIDYGNGSTQTGTLANDPSGIYTINGATTYAAAGTYNTQVTITSDAGDILSVNGQATVSSSTPLVSQGVNLQAQRATPIAPNVSGVANVVVAQFSGAPAAYSATINWGDSTSTVGQIVSLGNNQYYVEIPTGTSKSYAAVGSYTVSVAITDGTNLTTATSTATITAIPIVASQNLVLKPLLGGIVLTSVANFTADKLTNASAFRAEINWGDGTQSAGLVVRTSAGTYIVLGLHIYAHKGTYTVDTTILDSSASESAVATSSITIK